MRIRFCGTAAGALTPPRAASCILLEHEGDAILLDCGPGSLERVLTSGLSLPHIKGLLFSHLHMDHVQGFPELLAHMVFPFGALPFVYGPAGTKRYIEAAITLTNIVSRLPGDAPGTPFSLPIEELTSGDERNLLQWHARTVEVPHAPDVTALATRLTLGEKSIVYSGDTQPVPDIMVPLADGADALIHECYSEPGLDRWVAHMRPAGAAAIRDAFRSTHSDVDDVAAIAAAAGVRTLVLTHLNPGEDADELIKRASERFTGEVIPAEDRLTITV
ncbi:MAG: ribonuclease Z [Tepidiformaceae bacterium]